MIKWQTKTNVIKKLLDGSFFVLRWKASWKNILSFLAKIIFRSKGVYLLELEADKARNISWFFFPAAWKFICGSWKLSIRFHRIGNIFTYRSLRKIGSVLDAESIYRVGLYLPMYECVMWKRTCSRFEPTYRRCFYKGSRGGFFSSMCLERRRKKMMEAIFHNFNVRARFTRERKANAEVTAGICSLIVARAM